MNVTFILSDGMKQTPGFKAVSFKITEPLFISAALGEYPAFNCVAEGLNVPVPEVVHMPPPAITIEPANCTLLTCEQTSWSGPAFTAGSGPNLTVRLELTTLQLFWLVDVRVSTTAAAALSAAEGRYCAFKEVLFGEKVPVPAVVHIPVLAPAVTLPLRNMEGAATQTN
jgi:hypothetical protein